MVVFICIYEEEARVLSQGGPSIVKVLSRRCGGLPNTLHQIHTYCMECKQNIFELLIWKIGFISIAQSTGRLFGIFKIELNSKG